LDNSTIFLLAVVGLLGLMFVFLFATARRRDAQRALEQEPAGAVGDPTSPIHLPVPVGHVSASGRELEAPRSPPPTPRRRPFPFLPTRRPSASPAARS
jgi:hypothetical protein